MQISTSAFYESKVLYLAFTLEWIALHGLRRWGFADENVSLDLILRGGKIEEEAGAWACRDEVPVVRPFDAKWEITFFIPARGKQAKKDDVPAFLSSASSVCLCIWGVILLLRRHI